MSGSVFCVAALLGLMAPAVTIPAPAVQASVAAVDAWSVVPTPSPGSAQNTLFGLTTMPGGGVWAVGDRVSPERSRFIAPLVEHKGASGWSADVLPGDQTNLIAAYSPAPDNLWAVGFFQNGMFVETVPVISHYDGAGWQMDKSRQPQVSVLSAVDGTSAKDIWAAGRQFHRGDALTIIEHFQGHQWKRVASPGPATDYLDLNALDAISPDDVWAAGDFKNSAGVLRTLVMHYDGNTWAIVRSPNLSAGDNTLTALTTLRGRVWAVGRAADGKHSRAIALRWYDGRWTSQFLPRVGTGDASLNGVVTGPDHTLWAVGNKTNADRVQRTLTMRRTDGTWQVVPSPNRGSENNVLYGVTVTPSGVLWAVGSATSKTIAIRYPS